MTGTCAAYGRKRARPPALSGFSHVNRFWDATVGRWTAQVMPGEYYVTLHDEVIATVLGSCVSACVRDVERGIGGINHFMLPGDPDPAARNDSARYGAFALERLFNDLVKHGGRPRVFEIKIFGGGRVLTGLGDIGAENIAFVRQYLSNEGHAIIAEDVGGGVARRLRYHPKTGTAWVQALPTGEASVLDRAEADLRRALVERAGIPVEPELF